MGLDLPRWFQEHQCFASLHPPLAAGEILELHVLIILQCQSLHDGRRTIIRFWEPNRWPFYHLLNTSKLIFHKDILCAAKTNSRARLPCFLRARKPDRGSLGNTPFACQFVLNKDIVSAAEADALSFGNNLVIGTKEEELWATFNSFGAFDGIFHLDIVCGSQCLCLDDL